MKPGRKAIFASKAEWKRYKYQTDPDYRQDKIEKAREYSRRPDVVAWRKLYNAQPKRKRFMRKYMKDYGIANRAELSQAKKERQLLFYYLNPEGRDITRLKLKNYFAHPTLGAKRAERIRLKIEAWHKDPANKLKIEAYSNRKLRFKNNPNHY